MIESLARMASALIFQHEDEQTIVDARHKAIRFMDRGQWDKFLDLLLSTEHSDERVRDGRRRNSGGGSVTDSSGNREGVTMLPPHDLLDLDSDHSTLLHTLVTYCAPADAVRALHRTFPSMIRSTDMNGRTPLHRAVQCSASIQIIDCLLELSPPAADVRDCRGRTPLIQACVEMSHGSASETDYFVYSAGHHAGSQYSGKLIRRLVQASPRSVLAEDEDGWTALEYAIDAVAPKTMVRTLQRATVTTVREDKKEERRRRLSNYRRAREAKKQQQHHVQLPPYLSIKAAA